MAWLDVIQRISGVTAIGADEAPCLKDFLPKLVLRTPLRDQLRFVDLMIHAIPGWVGLELKDPECDRLMLLILLSVL